VWVMLGRANPSIPRKFGLGLIFNGLAFLLLMFSLQHLVGPDSKIPFWTLFMVYVVQSIGELCLSPIGLSMVTKLAPTRLVGLGMGGWFLSTGIGNNLSGIFASIVSGEKGMTVESALSAPAGSANALPQVPSATSAAPAYNTIVPDAARPFSVISQLTFPPPVALAGVPASSSGARPIATR